MIDLSQSCELLTAGEMGWADALTIAAGMLGTNLTESAGSAVADVVCQMLPPQRGSVAVLCGPGNNGGDGFVTARRLRASGCGVRLMLLVRREDLQGDAAAAAAAWGNAVDVVSGVELTDVDLIVDALFGAGLSRPLDGEARVLVERVNKANRPVVSIDVPSGVDGTTGEVRGDAINATATVTFFRAKPGHFLYPGAGRLGRLLIRDIGIGAGVLTAIQPAAGLNAPAAWHATFPWPNVAGHKYKRGHAVVVSGRASHTGAARLSARAALRVGAGLVTLASPGEAMAVNAAHLTAVMLRVSDGSEGLAAILADGRKNVVVLGPGLGTGPGTRALVEAALTTVAEPRAEVQQRACVLDADALTSFEGDADGLRALIAEARGPLVITPHDGEFARLFRGRSDVTGPPSKLDRVRAAAVALGCIVLLKGSDTVVAEASGRGWIADGGSQWLATAGSGDVLSGLIGGLLAQGMPAFEAANAAVWLHAEVARRFGPGLIAEDISDALPAVLKDLHAACLTVRSRVGT